MILPVVGLLLFAAVSYRSMSMNPQSEQGPNKYYWWSSMRLDTDPLNENPKSASPCANAKENCANRDLPNYSSIHPGWLDRLLIFSALPAFLAGAAIVICLSKLGIDEVLAFMVSMPIFLFAWYYFIGWLLDRWIYRRRQARSVRFKVT